MTDDLSAHVEPGATGLRTFLIADVRGYTAYTREQGDEVGAELAATFASTVREVVTTRDGFLVELRGDEALVVFESARQALRAAVELQARFVAVALPRGVGIGLDAGEAVPVEGGFRGGAVNLAARLTAQARAGEILASETVIHLAARIEGISYVEPRTLSLKGYPEPVRAVEVVSSDRARTGLHRRVRSVRRGFRSHRRLALGAIGIAVVVAIVGVIGTLPRGGASPNASPSRSPTLADLPPGVALVDAATGKEIAVVPTTTIKTPVDVFYADGSFWVANLDPQSMVQVDAKTGAVLRQISIPFANGGGSAVDGKALWMSDYEHPVIVKVDIASGRQVEVARFDLSAKIDDPNDGFTGPIVGDGSLWLGGKDRHEIFRVDPTTGAIQADVKDVRSWSMAYGDGALWTGDFSGLDRIDTATNSVAHAQVPSGLVGGIVVGAGFVWTADESKGVVFKVDRAGAVVAQYATGLGARTVAFSDGTLWVANQDEGTVSGIDAVTGSVRTLTFDHPAGSVAAGPGVLAVSLGEGRSYEDRIDALEGKVARLFTRGYEFEIADPATQWSPEAFAIEGATCAKLVNYTDAPGATARLQPEIAAAMPSVSADGRTYTFTVRSGYRFSDPSGEEITAETFRDSIERALSPRLTDNPPGATFVTDIEGEQDFREGKTEHISGIAGSGDTLSVTLTEPSGDFLARLAMPFFCPVPIGTAAVAGAVEQRIQTPMGPVFQVPSAGPYYVADHGNGEYVILKRNEHYTGPRPHAFDAIALREGVNAGVAVGRIQSGEYQGVSDLDDLIFAPDGELATRWGADSAAAAAGDQRYYAVPDGFTLFLEFNASRPSFSDRRLRQAVSLALDRNALAAAAVAADAGSVASDSVLPPSMNNSNVPREVLTPNIDEARRLVGSAVGTALKLVFTSGCDWCQASAAEVTRDLDAIGLKVEVATVDNSFEAVHQPGAPYDMKIGLAGPTAMVFDPATLVTSVLRDDIPAEWLPASLSATADELAAATGENRYLRAQEVAEGPIATEVPFAVFAYSARGAYFGATIDCLEFWPTGSLDLAALCPKP